MSESERPSMAPGGAERRIHDRYDVTWAVDCVADDTFLYAFITNISELGIFVKTEAPLPMGAKLMLSFAPPGHEPFKLKGEVAWINPVRPSGDGNPGMGLRFVELTADDRERLVEIVKTMAYLRPPN